MQIQAIAINRKQGGVALADESIRNEIQAIELEELGIVAVIDSGESA